MVPGVNDNRKLRVYQQWKGNEVFFCGGRLVAGPNWRAVLGTAALIIAPTAIFIAFPATYLTLHVHAIIMVFSCLLPVLSIFFLFMTACRDPGILPRQEPDEEFLAGRKPRTKEVFVNNHRVVIRYNDTCHFYQPPRAHHCSVNDNCIERFDHHCPWVGTTIGKRNYRTFLLFVYITTVYCLYVIGCCLAQLFLRHNELSNEAGNHSNTWNQTCKDVAPALAVLGLTFLFTWFVGGLSGFHCYLAGTNQTTYENFRYNHDARPNPYDVGLLRNCYEVWCQPIPASQVNFRAFVGESTTTTTTAPPQQQQAQQPEQATRAHAQPEQQLYEHQIELQQYDHPEVNSFGSSQAPTVASEMLHQNYARQSEGRPAGFSGSANVLGTTSQLMETEALSPSSMHRTVEEAFQRQAPNAGGVAVGSSSGYFDAAGHMHHDPPQQQASSTEHKPPVAASPVTMGSLQRH